jgi:peptide/nickel transport system permease protein
MKRWYQRLVAWGQRPQVRWYIGRLAFWIGVLLTILFLTFFGLETARGASVPDALSESVLQTSHYLRRLIQGDLGTAYLADQGNRRVPVTEILWDVLPRSLGLLGVSLALSVALGVVAGIWSARKGRAPGLLLSILGLSMPSFFLALLLQLIVLSLTRQLGRSVLPVGGFGWDAHLILPALVLAARPFAQITRVTHISVSETLGEDFVRTARSKGLTSPQVWSRHVLLASAPPIITTVANSIRFSLSSLPVVELYFGWSGLGLALLRAIARRDDQLSAALALCLGLTFLVLTTISDLVVRRLDPRTGDLGEQRKESKSSWRDRLANISMSLLDLLPWRRREKLPSLELEGSAGSGESPAELRAFRRREIANAILSNKTFILGTVLVLGLLVLYFYGPALTRINPYATQGIQFEGGVLSVPPYPPDQQYWFGTDVLGRDLFSLIVAGARQTLTLVFFATGTRMLIGTLLGLLAGMNRNSLVDRLLSGLSQVFAGLPALLVAMILILGLGVRNGMWVFVVGLAAVGWSEIFTFVRAESSRLLARPYVESAIASGNSSTGIAVRHLLPNLLPSLISLTSIETASVLLIVGELGFLSIFLGGGLMVELYIDMPRYHYSDVPEWAALVSNIREYARAYAWIAIFPSMVFFIAVAAFNLFGEGLRSLLPRIGFGISRLFNRYTLAGAVAVVMLASWLMQAGGPIATYKDLSDGFDIDRAVLTVEELAGDDAPSRGIDTEGQWLAAEFLAERMEELGLQPAGEQLSYFFTVERDYFEVTSIPDLHVEGSDVELSYRQDFAEAPSITNSTGVGEGELVVLGLGPLSTSSTWYRYPYSETLRALDMSNQIVMLLRPVPQYLWGNCYRQGTLIVTDDPAQLERRSTLSAYVAYGFSNEFNPCGPVMYITREAAGEILASAGFSLDEIEEQEKLLAPDTIEMWNTGFETRMSIEGVAHSRVDVPHVLGYWPGVDEFMDEQLTILMAPYDGLRTDVLGVDVPGAVNDASSVGVILEALQTLVDGEYQPRRTILVIFYASQGFDFGRVPDPTPSVHQFLNAKPGFSLLTPDVVIWLRAAGGGDGNRLVIGGGGHMRLTQLAEQAAQLHNVRTLRDLTPLDVSVVYGETDLEETGEFPIIELGWEGGEELTGLPLDDMSALRLDAMQDVGRVLTLMLGMVARETTY